MAIGTPATTPTCSSAAVIRSTSSSKPARRRRRRTQDAWYVGLTANQDITEAISYSISAGHELRLGVQADSVEDWYLRPTINWKFFKDITFNTSFGYEHGQQTLISQPPSSETYDWYWVGLGANYGLTKRLVLDLSYRLTERSSNAGSRGYAQNLVGLRLTYLLQ